MAAGRLGPHVPSQIDDRLCRDPPVAGVNGLVMQHSLPLQTVRVLIAIPRQAYERYIDPKTSRGGALRGFEPVREAWPNPSPTR